MRQTTDATRLRLRHRDRMTTATAKKDEWIEIKGRPGLPPRRGIILDVLGPHDRPHFRVRWDDDHVSLYYPDDSSHFIVHGPQVAA